MTACSTCRHHHDNGIIRCDLKIPDFRRVYKGEVVCVSFSPETVSERDKLREEVERLKKENDALSSQVLLGAMEATPDIKYQQEMHAVTLERDELRKEVSDLKNKGTLLIKECDALSNEVFMLKNENAVLKGRVADLSVDKFCEATVTAENERLKEENATLRAELLAALRELRGKA